MKSRSNKLLSCHKVLASSSGVLYLRVSRQFWINLFLLRKDFKRKKTQIKQKPTNETKISEQ